MTDFETAFEKYQRNRQAQEAVNSRNKERIFDALRAAGIDRVNVTFDGAGDSGQIEAVTATAGERQVQLPEQPLTVERVPFGQTGSIHPEIPVPLAIEELCYAYLEQEHSGWENNDGAWGEFLFDVEARRITLDFEQRYTDSTTYSSEF